MGIMIEKIVGFGILTAITVIGNTIIIIAIRVEPRLKGVRIKLCSLIDLSNDIYLDRYLYLIESKMDRKKEASRRAFILIVLTWLIPCLVWIPGVLGRSYAGYSPLVADGCYFQAPALFALLTTIVLFFIPMIGMIVLYVKIFRVLHGQMNRLSLWLTETDSNNEYDQGSLHALSTTRDSTPSLTSAYHQRSIGSCNGNYFINSKNVTCASFTNLRSPNNNNTNRGTYRVTRQSSVPLQSLALTEPRETTAVVEGPHKFKRAVHAIVWLGRTRNSVFGNSNQLKGSFKEFRENSRMRSRKKLFYTADRLNPHHRNSTYRRAMVTDSLLQRQRSAERRQQQQKMRLIKQRRVARTLGVLIFVFLVSWLPFTIAWPIQRFCYKCVSNNLLRKTWWLTYANTFINPFLYFFLNKDFRYALRRILRCCFKQRQNGIKKNNR
ncbi:unnamed protein product [Didymodactylos carnosus]|uniref:G-protein coupled receptors family 1 profile domain-containing protein n=1 Tax=Didymodactylos carnosus TaxID=1234261 RepID=A0A813UTW4_9BILA|nr:unnamed protein product [Didymodactylos carnosus]CAF3620933.1 unnamed protein product [Didymodactylos carnosus]